MKKLIYLLVLVLYSSVSLMAQTIVGTEPENKNVVLEEFTGIHCVYCPQGHAIAQGIYDSHPEDVVLINIHQGSFAVPSGSEPDFRTPWGNAIAAQSGLVGYPAGTVNRHLFTGYSQGTGTAQSRGSWATTSNMILAEPSYLNVELEATIVTSTRQLVVYAEVYYTGDSPSETNFLNVAILQNNVLGPQTGGNSGNNYVHKHMLRHLVTGQWGAEINETSEGSLYTGTFTYEMPMDYNGVPLVLEDLDIVGFVTETHQEIISGNMAELTYVDSYERDAAIYSTYVPQTACSGELNAQVLLKNYGTDNLTSLDFVYSVNGGEPGQYSWTGELMQFETELITLPEYIYAPTDNNLISIECEMPNGQNDQLPRNDVFNKNTMGSLNLPSECYFGIQTPSNPADLTWNIVNGNGEVIAEGGPYTNPGFIVTPVTFPETGCYSLTVNDASGSGLNGGQYLLVDLNSNELWMGQPFTYVAMTEFAYDITIDVPEASNISSVSVYPNPASDNLNVEFNLNQNNEVNITLTDMIGKVIYQNNNKTATAGTVKYNINTGSVNAGMYLLSVQIGNEISTQKVVVR